MSSVQCTHLHAFVDGELEPAAAEDFRDHLAACEACARALHEEMMNVAVRETYRAARSADARRGASNVRLLRGSSRAKVMRAAIVTAIVPTMAAAAWALAVRYRTNEAVEVATIALESAKVRSTEVRLAYAAADRYRPFDVARGVAARRHEEVPLATLATLERRGDLQGVAAGLVLAGDIERADGYLERARPSVEVDADRAAVMLDRGKAADALAALDAVLARAPTLPQALFNRALALRNLDLPLAAAEAFDKVAALGEAGWAEEAKRASRGAPDPGGATAERLEGQCRGRARDGDGRAPARRRDRGR